MKKNETLQAMIEGILNQDRRALARAITLIESKNPAHLEQSFALLDALLSHTGKSLRIGISGAPGVGKSTIIEALGLWLIGQGKRVAVLTIDPSSVKSGGSILGDKTRMQKLSIEERAFIRTSPSSGILGGVGSSTREAMMICDAAGFDVIIVETVGVGQSELTIASMVDTFVLLVQPGGGDELQGVKKGILELVDIVVVNKTDGDLKKLANQTMKEYARSATLIQTQKNQYWKVPVLKASALYQEGMKEIWKYVEGHRETLQKSGDWKKKISEQNEQWFLELALENLLQKIKEELRTNSKIYDFLSLVQDKKLSTRHAAFLVCRQLTKYF